MITASEKCQQEKRKTVNGEDILFAMTSLGFENYSEALKIYLARYREVSYHTFHFFIAGRLVDLDGNFEASDVHLDFQRNEITWARLPSCSHRQESRYSLPHPSVVHVTRSKILPS